MSEALVPDVVHRALPATILPTSLDEFEGWTPDDVVTWLKGIGRDYRNGRLSIGLGLWVLLERLDEEAVNGIVGELADLFDVDRSTMWRWRKAAQEHYKLPEPKAILARTPTPKAPKPAPEPSHSAKDAKEGRSGASRPRDQGGSEAPEDLDETPPSTGVGRKSPPPAEGSHGVSSRGSEQSGDAPTPVELTRQDVVRVIEWLNGRPLTWVDDVPLDVLRTHATWAQNAERRAIAKSAERTVAKHKAEQAAAPRPLARQTVTPNFKGSSK